MSNVFTLQGNLKIPDEGGKIGSDTTDDAITIDSIGNIGIGTNNPTQKLDIKGGNLIVRSKSENTDAVIYIGVPDINATNPGVSKAAIFFEANATGQGWSTGTLHICNREAINDNSANAGTGDARISIKPDGNVGIGKSNPNYKLDIEGGDTVMRLKNTENTDSRCTIVFNTDNSDWELGARGSNGNPDNTFYIYKGDYAMIINSDRHVGFGTTEPQKKLHVEDKGSSARQMRIQGPDFLFGTRAWELQVSSGGITFWNEGTSGTGNYFKINNDSTTSSSSDDRLKTNEEYITDALNTIMKLKPQLYNMGDNEVKTPGLIAQDVYYDCPELRCLVNVPEDAEPGDKPITPEDPSQDPDYSNWGSTYAGLQYSGFSIYLIKAVQELTTQLDAEKVKTATLETKVTTLESQVVDLLARVTALENP